MNDNHACQFRSQALYMTADADAAARLLIIVSVAEKLFLLSLLPVGSLFLLSLL